MLISRSICRSPGLQVIKLAEEQGRHLVHRVMFMSRSVCRWKMMGVVVLNLYFKYNELFVYLQLVTAGSRQPSLRD